MRIVLTGSGTGKDDWGSTLAAHSANDLLLPYVVLSGSSYAFEHVSEVVRVGRTGQLPDLLVNTGTLIRSEQVVPLPGADSEAQVRAYLRDRAAAYGATAGAGRPQRYAELFDRALGQVDRLAELSDTLDFRGSGTNEDGLEMWSSLEVAIRTLGLGAARCAMVQYDGLWSMGWDSHSQIAFQSSHFEGLFAHLNKLMETLAAEPGTAGGSMLDEVTVVVLSEMGRGPRLNSWGGKDHFTFTSAMVMGSGVRGGLSIGGGDDYGIGRKIDLETGEFTDSGTAVQAAHFGATLLALGDIDPAQELTDAPPILAMLE